MTTVSSGAFALRSGVTLHAPGEEGGHWTVRRADGTYVRVGSDMGALLAEVREAATPAELAERMGERWTAEDVSTALAAAVRMEVVDDGAAPAERPAKRSAKRAAERPRSGRRVAFVPPLTVQLTVLRPERVAERVRPLLRAIPDWFVRALLLLPLPGLVVLAVQSPAVLGALSEPVSFRVLLVVAIGSFLATSLHELGHGAALTRQGGAPTRLGVMLFYLTPAMFCDVSNGWLLPRRSQRVAIALAGVGTQAVIGGVCALLFGVLAVTGGSSDAQDALVLLAVGNYVASIINLTPLVKFDGYIALMTHLDLPFLRKRATEAARDLAAWVLLGAARPAPAALGTRWLPWFGVGCLVFPVVLVVSALSLWGSILAGIGIGGRIVLAAVVVLVLVAALRSLWSLVRHARTAGAATPRILAGLAVVAALTALVAVVPVPARVSAAYLCADGRAHLLVDDAADRAAVSGGDPVSLRSRGVLLSLERGSTTVAADPTPVVVDAPFSSFVPVSDLAEIPLASTAIALEDCAGADSGSGGAVVDVGTTTLGERAVVSFLLPLLR